MGWAVLTDAEVTALRRELSVVLCLPGEGQVSRPTKMLKQSDGLDRCQSFTEGQAMVALRGELSTVLCLLGEAQIDWQALLIFKGVRRARQMT